MLPLVGGSGGGGGSGSRYSTGVTGGGGGGGGGALLIAASGTVKLNGSILAQGGAGSVPAGCSWSDSWVGGGGGGGSGGIVRILAQAYQNTGGTINVAGGPPGCSGYWWASGAGSQGYVSVETPRGGTLSLSGLASLQITSVGGQSVPANPTGIGDVTLPATQTNPVPIQITARFVPPGTTVKLVLTPAYSGDVVTVNASNLAGTLETSTAGANINVPYGASTLIAQVSFSLTVAMGEALSVYAEGERVDSVRLTAAPGGPTQFKLVTVSGREFDAPPAVMAMIPPN